MPGARVIISRGLGAPKYMALRDTLSNLLRPGLPRRRADMWAAVYDASVGTSVRADGGDEADRSVD